MSTSSFPSQESLLQIFKFSQQAFLVLREQKIIACNPAACNLLRRTEAELINQNPASVIKANDSDPSTLQQKIFDLCALASKEKVASFEIESGTALPETARIRLQVLAIDSGNAPDFVLHLDPLNESPQTPAQRSNRKNATESTVDSDAAQIITQMAQQMQAIGLFTSSLAHDFNNILTGVTGSSDILQLILNREELQNKERIFSILNVLQNTAQRASNLVMQLLTITKNQTDSQTIVDLNASIRHVIKYCRVHTSQKIKIDVEPMPDGCLIMGDPVLLEQAILNIMQNAIQAIASTDPDDPPVTGQIQVMLKKADSPSHPTSTSTEEYCLLQIIDNGPGIQSSLLDQVCDPFFTTRSRAEHKGLGLSIARSIIQDHQGLLEIQPQQGNGTRVFIYLPLKPMAVKKSRQPAPELMISPLHKTVLIIDDQEEIRQILHNIFQELGCNTYLARDGKEGLQLYRGHKDTIDLVFLDISMPEQTGPEVFTALQSINPAVQIYLMSGIQINPAIQSLLDAGASGFLSKPLSIQTLLETIQALKK